MGRRANVRYWQRKGGGYFTTHNGAQIELALGPDDQAEGGPTYRAALVKWSELVCGTAEPARITFAGVLQRWLEADHVDSQATSREHTRRLVSSFGEETAAIPVVQLLPAHVSAWFAGRPSWSATTRYIGGSGVLSVLNWGVREGVIASNPLSRRLRLPRPRRRGAAARMSATTMDTIEAHASTPAFRFFLEALRGTGARPVELREASWDRYRSGRIVHPWQTDGYQWKNARKTQRDRVIFLPRTIRHVLDNQADGERGRWVFRTQKGHKWQMDNAKHMWARTLDRPAVRAHLDGAGLRRADLTLYSYRHTFISDWLERGGGLWEVSQICGTSVSQIQRTYGHSDPSALEAHYLRYASSP